MLSCSFKGFSKLFLLISVLLQACGADYQTEHVRDYRIYVESQDPEMVETIEALAVTFNDQYGEDVLTFTDDAETANSFIRFRDGLVAEQGKLGYGNWVATSTFEDEDLMPGKRRLQRTIVYSMDIEFDRENIKKRVDSRFDHNSNDWAHLYHLFCHEVGHGMQMDHSEIQNSVMYKSIGEGSRPDVDYDKFFAAARHSLKPVDVE